MQQNPFKVIDIWKTEVYLTENIIIIIIGQLMDTSIGLQEKIKVNKNSKWFFAASIMATWPRVQLFYIMYVFLKGFLFAHWDFCF